MRIYPKLSFNGDCEAAFTLYASCLGGEITYMLTYAASPTPPPLPEFAEKIIHATLKLGDQTITGADVQPNLYQKPQGFSLQMNIADPAAAERIFNTLADGGFVHMPLQKTFWSPAFGVVTDLFGNPWEINCTAAAEDTTSSPS